MTTPAENDHLLALWIEAERGAETAEARVRQEQSHTSNLPIPAPNPPDLAEAQKLRADANFRAQDFLKLNGVIHPFGPEYRLASSAEFQRLLTEAVKKHAPAAVFVPISNAYKLAVASERGGALPTGTTSPDGRPAGSAPAGTTATSPAAPSSLLSSLGTFALLTSPAWLAVLLLRGRR